MGLFNSEIDDKLKKETHRMRNYSGIDQLMITTALPFLETCNKYGITANMLTTMSLIFGLISIYYFITDKYIYSSIYYILGYWFDCADGPLARYKDKSTSFGDLYDHFTDWGVSGLFFIIAFFKLDFSLFYKIIFFILIGTILHFSCISKAENKQGTILAKYTSWIPVKEEWAKYTNMFDTGPYTFIIAFLIVFLNKKVYPAIFTSNEIFTGIASIMFGDRLIKNIMPLMLQ